MANGFDSRTGEDHAYLVSPAASPYTTTSPDPTDRRTLRRWRRCIRCNRGAGTARSRPCRSRTEPTTQSGLIARWSQHNDPQRFLVSLLQQYVRLHLRSCDDGRTNSKTWRLKRSIAPMAFHGQSGIQKKKKKAFQMHGPLRSVARRLIDEGHLPNDATLRVYGGPSAGAICRLCGQPIKPRAAEIEIETDEPTSVLLHPDCYAIWLAEVRSSGSSTR